MQKKLVVLVTGLSGAGLSTAIKALEDNAFFCMDNVPVGLVASVLEFLHHHQHDAPAFALGIDQREEDFAVALPALLKRLRTHYVMDVLYLKSEIQVLADRYSTTRRKHPYMSRMNRQDSLMRTIEAEKAFMAPIEACADVVLDTTAFSPHYLGRVIEKRYAHLSPTRHLMVTVTSFGFKHGVLTPAESIFDVRMLQNPHYIPKLRPLSGLDQAVQDFVLMDHKFEWVKNSLTDYLKLTLPMYYEEGKHYFRVGIGCTGGRHRSVFMAEALTQALKDASLGQIELTTLHRDLSLG